MDSGSAIQVCVYCQLFEIPVPGTEWGDFDSVTSGSSWLVSAGFWLQGWICTHWPPFPGGCSPGQWSQHHWIFSLFLLIGDLNLPLGSQQEARLESALSHVEHYSLFFPLEQKSWMPLPALDWSPEVCSSSPFLTLFSFYFSSTAMFMVGLRPAMCFKCSLYNCYHYCKWKGMPSCLDCSLCFLSGRTNGIPKLQFSACPPLFVSLCPHWT